MFTKETASPAVLIGRGCLCSLPMALRARRWCAGRSAVLQLPDPLPPAVWQKPGATVSSPAPMLTAVFCHHRQNPRLPSSRETWMSTQMTHLILSSRLLDFLLSSHFCLQATFFTNSLSPILDLSSAEVIWPLESGFLPPPWSHPPSPSSCFTLQCGNPFKDTIKPPHP